MTVVPATYVARRASRGRWFDGASVGVEGRNNVQPTRATYEQKTTLPRVTKDEAIMYLVSLGWRSNVHGQPSAQILRLTKQVLGRVRLRRQQYGQRSKSSKAETVLVNSLMGAIRSAQFSKK